MTRFVLPTMLAFCALALGGRAPAIGAGAVTVTSPDGLNLRNAPNTQAQVLAVIPVGSVLALTGDPTPDHWYPVAFGGLSGWAYGAYLADGLVSPSTAPNAAPIAAAPPVPPTPTQTAGSPPTAPGSASAASTPLGVTASPSPAPAAQPVATGPSGTPPSAPSTAGVGVAGTPTSQIGATNPGSMTTQPPAAFAAPGGPPNTQTLSGFGQPFTPGQQQQASAAAPSSSTTMPPPGTVMMVNTDALNLRATPDMSGRIVTALPKGTMVQVAGPAVTTWLPVAISGITGFVDSTYLVNPAAALTNAAAGSTLSPTSSAATSSAVGLSAAMFGNPPLGTPAGVEAGQSVAVAPPGTMGKFIWPVTMRRITTVFKPIHQAIDIDQFPGGGNPVSVISDGIVTYAGGDACCSYGLYVIVQHRDGFSSLYSHLSRVDVTQGQLVRQGLQLGLSGNTGNSTGPHLHFAIYLNGLPLDPLTVLPGTADVMPYASVPSSGPSGRITAVAD